MTDLSIPVGGILEEKNVGNSVEYGVQHLFTTLLLSQAHHCVIAIVEAYAIPRTINSQDSVGYAWVAEKYAALTVRTTTIAVKEARRFRVVLRMMLVRDDDAR